MNESRETGIEKITSDEYKLLYLMYKILVYHLKVIRTHTIANKSTLFKKISTFLKNQELNAVL